LTFVDVDDDDDDDDLIIISYFSFLPSDFSSIEQMLMLMLIDWWVSDMM